MRCPEREDVLVAPPLVVWPVGDCGGPFQPFNVLLGLNGIFSFSPVEKGDVRGPPDPVVGDKGILKCCCHRDWSVVVMT